MMSESHKIDREENVKLHSWTISGKSLSMLINERVRMILMSIECVWSFFGKIGLTSLLMI